MHINNCPDCKSIRPYLPDQYQELRYCLYAIGIILMAAGGYNIGSDMGKIIGGSGGLLFACAAIWSVKRYLSLKKFQTAKEEYHRLLENHYDSVSDVFNDAMNNKQYLIAEIANEHRFIREIVESSEVDESDSEDLENADPTADLFNGVIKNNGRLVLDALNRGADPYKVDADGESPFSFAKEQFRPRLLLLMKQNHLEENQSKVNQKLFEGVLKNNKPLIIAALEQGADPEAIDADDDTPTSLATAFNFSELLSILRRQYEAPLDVPD